MGLRPMWEGARRNADMRLLRWLREVWRAWHGYAEGVTRKAKR
jgi:hypothetical protein